jgi:hypothetical protein
MKVLRASRPAETNVVPIRSGTFGWLKQEDNKRKAALTLIASRGGM